MTKEIKPTSNIIPSALRAMVDYNNKPQRTKKRAKVPKRVVYDNMKKNARSL